MLVMTQLGHAHVTNGPNMCIYEKGGEVSIGRGTLNFGKRVIFLG